MNARAFASGSFSRHGKESGMSQLTEIPVVAQQAIAIFAFLDASLAATPFSISFAERMQPGAAEAVIAWARAHSLPVSEVWFPQNGGYANVKVVTDSGRDINVLHSRNLTAEELETLLERTHLEVTL